MFEVVISNKVEKFLDKQTLKTVEKFSAISSQIGHYGQTLSNIDIKRLKGEEANHFRLRINKIRFVYKVMIKENIILFYNAGYRGDVYK